MMKSTMLCTALCGVLFSGAQAAIHSNDQTAIEALCKSISNLSAQGGSGWAQACAKPPTPIGKGSGEVMPDGIVLNNSNPPRIQSLTIVNKGLNGTLPIELGQLAALNHLDLSNNSTLSGALPPVLGSLSELRGLNLSGNQFSGSIPSGWDKLTKLTLLELTNNQLSGTLPVGFSQLTLLGNLSMGSNQLTGSIPSSWANLTKLWRFNVSGNQLSGSLPVGFSQLADLERLYIENNQLSGTIPDFSQTKLCDFNLRENHFTFADILQNDTKNRQKIGNCPSSGFFNYRYYPQKTIDTARISKVGQVLNVNYRAHVNDEIQWFQGTSSNPTVIAGATGTSYTPKAAGSYFYQVNNPTLARFGNFTLLLTSQLITVANLPTYEMGGKVSGIPSSARLFIRLSHNGTQEDKSLETNGNYRFHTRLKKGTQYTVSIVHQPDLNTICTPETQTGTVAESDILNLNITCQPRAKYTVFLDVRGLGTQKTLKAQLGNEILSINQNGKVAFTQDLVDGSRYRVTIADSQQPVGQACRMDNPLGGIINGSNVSLVVICTVVGSIFNDSFEK